MVLASQQRRSSSRSSSSSSSNRNSRGKSAMGKVVGISMLALVVVAGSSWYLKPEWFKKAPATGGAQMASNLAPGQTQVQVGVTQTPQPGSIQPGATPTAPAAPAKPLVAPAAPAKEPAKLQSGVTPAASPKAEVQSATDNTRLGTTPAPAAPAKTEPVKHAGAPAAAPQQTPPAMMQTSAVQSTPTTVSVPNVAKAVSGPATTQPSEKSASAALTGEQAKALPAVPKVVELPANMSVPDRMAKGMELIGDGKLVEGRRVLSSLLTAPDAALVPMDAQAIRDTLQSINQKLIFSKEVDATDPLVEQYVIKPGDFLAKLARKNNVPFEFLEYINNTTAKKVQIGQKLKLVHGPFHAVVDKSAYRMDIYADEPSGDRVYIRSFPVGHGAGNGTPVGAFIIRAQGKVTNPRWINPQTGEHFEPDDVKNPIGEYWLGLQGTTPETAVRQGYGIHGTVEPDSIGSQNSMGCVRLRDDDIKMVYFMLQDGQSTVVILP